MKKKNIIPTGTVLLTLVIVIGANLDLVGAKASGVLALGLKTAGETSAALRNSAGLAGERLLVVDSKGVNALKDEALSVSAEAL